MTRGLSIPKPSRSESAECAGFCLRRILGAPFTVTRSLCTTMNIAVVAAGSGQTSAKMGDNAGDPYQVPKEAGIFVSMDSGHAVTTSAIRERIVTNFKVTTAPPPGPFPSCPPRLCWPP